MLDYEQVSSHQAQAFQVSSAPAPHDGADHSRVKQVLFQISPPPPPTTVRITQRENSRSSMKTNQQ